MKYGPRFTKQERRELRSEQLARALSGSGSYIYQNNTGGDLKLPKPTAAGIRTVGKGMKFEGDSYYMSLVGPPMNLLKLVEEITPKLTQAQINENRENEMTDKLILDQPNTVTQKGQIEHVVATDSQPRQLNDGTTNDKAPEVLLNENPLDGVEIILV